MSVVDAWYTVQVYFWVSYTYVVPYDQLKYLAVIGRLQSRDIKQIRKKRVVIPVCQCKRSPHNI